MQNMGWTFQQWLVSPHISWPLLYPCCVCQAHMTNLHHWNNLLQAQIFDTATVTPADTIVKAYQDLIHAIKCILNSKGTAHIKALQSIKKVFKPWQLQPIDSLLKLQGWPLTNAPPSSCISTWSKGGPSRRSKGAHTPTTTRWIPHWGADWCIATSNFTQAGHQTPSSCGQHCKPS